LKKVKPIFLILLLSLSIQLLFISRHPLWYDEVASMVVAKQNTPLKLINLTATDTHPPLYFLLLKAWSRLSSNIYFLRFLSIIFASFTIYVSYLVFRELATKKQAIFATLLITLSPPLIYASTQIRMYSLFVFESMLLFWIYIKYQKSCLTTPEESVRLPPRCKITLIIFTILSIISLYTHYYAGLLLISLNIIFFFNKKRHSLIKSWLVSQLIVLFSFLPWLIFNLSKNTTSCWCFSPLVGLPAVFYSFVAGGLGLITIKDVLQSADVKLQVVFIFAAIFLFGLFLSGVKSAWSEKKHQVLSIFFMPLLLVSLVGFIVPIFSPRALIILSPFYYLLITQGIFSIENRYLKQIVILSTLLILVIVNITQLTNQLLTNIPSSKTNLIYNEDTLDYDSPMLRSTIFPHP